MTGKILVIDDDPNVRRSLQKSLESVGFQVTSLPDGTRLDETLANSDIDLAIIDILIPGEDGLSLTRRVREKFGIGVIILSGQGQTTDRIVGLEVGADDYIVKPFEVRELIARVRSVMRRLSEAPEVPAAERSEKYQWDNWQLDVTSHLLYDPNNNNVVLTTSEYRLLEVFVSNPNRVLDRERLMYLTSAHDSPAFDRSIDVRITRLRKKLAWNSDAAPYIKTVRNSGYMFAAKVERL